MTPLSDLICRFLDHAVLAPQLTVAEARQAIELGLAHQVRTVCVRPMDIALAQSICRGNKTEVGTVLAFPHGTATSGSKADEAGRYLDEDVAEIDMVANYALIRSDLWDLVEADIRAVSDLTAPAGKVLKVILETSALTPERIARATRLAAGAGAQFVKTSTGFAEGGATFEAVRVMVQAAGGKNRRQGVWRHSGPGHRPKIHRAWRHPSGRGVQNHAFALRRTGLRKERTTFISGDYLFLNLR